MCVFGGKTCKFSHNTNAQLATFFVLLQYTCVNTKHSWKANRNELVHVESANFGFSSDFSSSAYHGK